MRVLKAVGLIFILFMYGCGSAGGLGGALKVYEKGEYHKTISILKRSYSKEKNKYTKGEISFYMGESYRILNIPTKAASAYSKAVRYKYEVQEAELYMAESYLKAGKIENAREAFISYLEKRPVNVRAQNGLKSCDLAEGVKEEESQFIINKEKVFNSKFSDYSPVYLSSNYDMIYFSSMRMEKKKKRGSRINGQGSSNIYMSKLDAKGKWTVPEALGETINSEFDEGAISVSADSKEMYFTRCSFSPEKALGAEIYKVERAGGRWGDPVLIEVLGDSLVAAHPAISPDGNSLYFVSDMPGGQGGKDIWKSEKMDEGWSIPENLGSLINTSGDEMFPYVSLDGTFYFSSNAHVGYGGLDIYKLEISEDGKQKVVNIGPPVNTSADDFGIVFKGKENEGLFCSSRDNMKGIDNIYSFSIPKIELSLSGSIINDKTEEPIGDAYLRVVADDGTNQKLPVASDGSFYYDLKENTQYVFLIAAKGYFNVKRKISTADYRKSKDFEFDIRLVPIERALAVDNINFKAGEYEVTNEVGQALEKLLSILKDNISLKVEIASHTDSFGDETENIVLSQKRAQAIVDYLIEKGVAEEQLIAKGYGDSQPVEVDKVLARKYKFLKDGDVLDDELISIFRSKDQKIAHELNRRVEFKILNE